MTASSRPARRLFFFPAEGGIRDVAVTGVQTCALPISANTSLLGGGGVDGAIQLRPRGPMNGAVHPATAKQGGVGRVHDRVDALRGDVTADGLDPRSEERRVGKEGRARMEGETYTQTQA